jgi:para-nitrobenzyl esterase
MIDRRSFIKKTSAASFIGLLPGAVKLDSRVKENSSPLAVSANTAVVETISGKVRGYVHRGVFTFKGIPYADTAAAQNRFMPPQPARAWEGVRDSLAYGPVCPQRPNKGWSSEEYAFLFQWNDGHAGEDCLRLNIWSPRLDSSAKKAVMFWIHGGAYFSGSSQEHPSYDGRNLSALGDVVVVSVNHRLNIFGFLDLSAHGTQYQDSGNVGMLDLVAALEWVKVNIANFGGDPDNVTIFGQSGGAAKVTTLMAMPKAKGLFHKAISQSTSTAQVASKEYSAALASHALAYLNISKENISDLHTIDFRKLVDASIEAEKKMAGGNFKAGRSGWQPVVDGKIIPTDPFTPAAPAISENIPLLIGSNRNEWSASIGDAALESLTEDQLRAKLEEKYPGKGEALYKVCRLNYPQVKPVEILSYLNPYNNMGHVLAVKKAAQSKGNVFLYMFSWNTTLMDGRPRAYHCSEIPFIFYNTDRCATMSGATDEARELSSKMCAAWVNFAKTGNPNHSKLPEWPAFTAAKGETMIFDNTPVVKNDPDRDFRNFYMKI